MFRYKQIVCRLTEHCTSRETVSKVGNTLTGGHVVMSGKVCVRAFHFLHESHHRPDGYHASPAPLAPQ